MDGNGKKGGKRKGVNRGKWPSLGNVWILALERSLFSYAAGSSDGFFQFELTDGTHTIRDQLMPIKVVYLRLTMDSTFPLHVFPASIPQRLTAVQLNTTTNNPQHRRPIVFDVVQPPTRGRLGMVSCFRFLSTSKATVSGRSKLVKCPIVAKVTSLAARKERLKR